MLKLKLKRKKLMSEKIPLQFPNNKSPLGKVICKNCECKVFIPAVELEVKPDPKGIIGQYGLEVMQVFMCTKCGEVWNGPK